MDHSEMNHILPYITLSKFLAIRNGIHLSYYCNVNT